MARRILLRIAAGARAPREPGCAALIRLYQRAWETTPASRRPRTPPRIPLAVNLMWVQDREIAELHRRYFGRREATDVVSFPMLDHDPERDAFLLGEIAVSCETARREAGARHLPLVEELSRYALHGFLHLIGYRDTSARERNEMTGRQERILAAHFRH